MSKTINAVTHVMEMDRELERLRFENAMLTEALNQNSGTCNCSPAGVTNMDRIAIKYGKKKLYDSVFYYGHFNVTAKRDGDNVIYTEFDEWATSYIKYNSERVPLDVTFKDVIDYFKDELMSKYQEKCKEAYENLLKAEQEESEDEE